MEMPLFWVQALCCAPKGNSGLLRIGQDSHYGENSLGGFVLLCYHSWLCVMSLTPGMCRAEVLVVWKRAELSPVGSGGSHTAVALQAQIMLSLRDEPAGTADTALLFKCKQLFMVQESISHCPAQSFFKKPSSP